MSIARVELTALNRQCGLFTRLALMLSTLVGLESNGQTSVARNLPEAERSFVTLSNLPPHPRLLLNSNGIAQLRQKIQSAPWARTSWEALKRRVDGSLDQPLVLPERGGNWSHNYVCPTHGARLRQGKQLGPWEWEHHCPNGDHLLRGDRSKAASDFDGNAISSIHGSLAEQVVNSGLVFQVTRDSRYALKARQILLAYAERYLSYPLHDNQGNEGRGGRVASQSLTEATWLIDVAQGADLIWQTLSETDRKNLAEKLFRPALEQVILPRRLGIHNIQCRHNSAIGLVGFLLNDPELVSIAIDDSVTGFRQQLAKGVLEDGMWLEGSSGYHFFTISGLWQLAEAARNCGIDLYDSKFASMYDGPLRLSMPDYVLPNFNDSGTVPLRNQADLYELAFARYGRAAYLPLLHPSDRDGRFALLFGVQKLPPLQSVPPLGSRNSTASGYAILQSGQGPEATWLCVKYGPHGGGHGHPDKNTFILYARGQILATDAGTHAYGSRLHRDWDKTTFAHNTLVVDETSQQPATGKCISFGTERGVDYSITEAGPIYPGIRFIRTAAVLDRDLILLVDQIQAEDEHTFDLAYHQVGGWTKPADQGTNFPVKPWPSSPRDGYCHLQQATGRSVPADEQLTLRTKVKETWTPALAISATAPTEVVAGYGILKTSEDLVPLMFQRQTGTNAVFIWAISISGAEVKLKHSPVADPAGKALPLDHAVLVNVGTPKRKWTVIVNPDSKTLSSEMPGQPVFRTEAPITIR